METQEFTDTVDGQSCSYVVSAPSGTMADSRAKVLADLIEQSS